MTPYQRPAWPVVHAACTSSIGDRPPDRSSQLDDFELGLQSVINRRLLTASRWRDV